MCDSEPLSNSDDDFMVSKVKKQTENAPRRSPRKKRKRPDRYTPMWLSARDFDKNQGSPTKKRKKTSKTPLVESTNTLNATNALKGQKNPTAKNGFKLISSPAKTTKSRRRTKVKAKKETSPSRNISTFFEPNKKKKVVKKLTFDSDPNRLKEGGAPNVLHYHLSFSKVYLKPT